MDNQALFTGKITYIDGTETAISCEKTKIKNFQKNKTIVAISIPPSITEIKGWTFHLCTNLKSVVLPETLIEIGSGAFAYCKNLESIELHSNIKSIGKYAFVGCPKLKIKFNGTIGQWRKLCNDEKVKVEYGIDRSHIHIVETESDSSIKMLHENDSRQSIWNNGDVLYIYKNLTVCHRRKHNLISATALITGRNYAEIKLNVEYCEQCNRFYMNYVTYEHYRELYGILLGNFHMYSTTDHNNAFLASESPLKLCGYSVNQMDGLSDFDRQYIISQVIDKNILQKREVIRYLEYFINMNGKKRGNELAESKWKTDLEFALSYKSELQIQHHISAIEKY